MHAIIISEKEAMNLTEQGELCERDFREEKKREMSSYYELKNKINFRTYPGGRHTHTKKK